MLKLIAFYDGDEPVAALTYYACHPQSYYRTGLANPDFPGLAREARQEATGVPHLHFDGAGGNIGAGKWNDGSHEIPPDPRRPRRRRHATRLVDAAGERRPVVGRRPRLGDRRRRPAAGAAPGRPRSWKRRWPMRPPTSPTASGRPATWPGSVAARQGDTIPISCLTIGPATVLHLPGELFVEYQLAAQAMRPDRFVCMAAYGDYAPGYIGTACAYYQGGYEASPRASNVAPDGRGGLAGGDRDLLLKK